MDGGVPLRVLIVDDHHMVREGLKKYFSASDDLEVVGEARNGAEAVEVAKKLEPDVILMDMAMPVMDGAEATKRIKTAQPDIQIIALTSFVEEDLVKRAVDAGAISYLLKDARPEVLLQAVRDACAGRGTIDSAAMRVLLQQRDDPVGRDLTKREREVLALLAKGLTNEEIAGRLFLSEATVRLHVSNILTKLGASNRTSAVVIALEHGLA